MTPRRAINPELQFWQASQEALNNLNAAMQVLLEARASGRSIPFSPAEVHEVKRNLARFQEQFALLVREQKRKAVR